MASFVYVDSCGDIMGSVTDEDLPRKGEVITVTDDEHGPLRWRVDRVERPYVRGDGKWVALTPGVHLVVMAKEVIYGEDETETDGRRQDSDGGGIPKGGEEGPMPEA